MHLYDPKKEAKLTERALIDGNVDFIEQATTTTDTEEEEFDFTALFEEEEEGTEAVITDTPLDHTSSFYPTDFDFYKALVYYLKSQNAIEYQST